MRSIAPYSDEQLRVLVNLEQQYDTWMEAERASAELAYGMSWKTVSGKDYLYELIDRRGNGKSLGPRSPVTEATYADYGERKKALADRRARSRAALQETSRLYRVLRLPMIAGEAAKILLEADRRRLLGAKLQVVGTNAMAAYSIEAGGRILHAPDETQDFDMAWTGAEAPAEGVPIWEMLKAVDGTYTINSERPFQARNAAAYEVELLIAPSLAHAVARTEKPRPISLPEQEWLLQGRRVAHVVVARDGQPARVVAPDPRWFALQKLWMSAQEKRNPLKRPRDARQGTALLNAVRETMPQFPLDKRFEAEIPAELMPHYQAWNLKNPPASAPTAW